MIILLAGSCLVVVWWLVGCEAVGYLHHGYGEGPAGQFPNGATLARQTMAACAKCGWLG